MTDRTALVTGATGYVGSQLVPALLEAGWRVRCLSRDPARLDPAWSARVETVQAALSDPQDVRRALAGVEVAYYLVHSMTGHADYRVRDRSLAGTFAGAARAQGVRRIVYLGGLHPAGAPLSDHMASRVEVGRLLLDSGVPTAALQAGVVLGEGSASFQMLRHLAERLPVAVGPRWLRNRIQPIAIGDVVHYLVVAAELDDSVNRTIDIGMPEQLRYVDMMRRYSRAVGLRRRFVGTVPVLTPGLASHWVGFVTPVDASLARPLVGSLTQDATVADTDTDELLGRPPGGPIGFDEAVRLATAYVDPRRWGRTLGRVGAAVLATAVVGSLLTDPKSPWYRSLRTPRWMPPPAAFPVVWTTLYSLITVAATATIADSQEAGRPEQARRFSRALAVNLVLNAGWSGLFFRMHNLPAATLGAAALTVSAADLARRSAPTGRGKAVTFALYAGWCATATVLSATLDRLNPRR